jgi:type IX secretion system PorP/SprF family membrane protein
MRRLYFTGLIILIGLITSQIGYSQSTKYISQFSHFQSYFNPGLTGYEGSTVRGFVRNQWSGFEGAPKTYFFSTELDFGELSGERDPELTGKNAVSLNLLHDTYGAFRETELMLNYASRVRLTEKHNLRLGAGVSYQSIRLDGNALTTEEQNDQTLGQYIGQFSNMNVVDFNLGIALTHAKYYISYGMHRVNGGKITSGDEFMDGYPAAKMIQAGFREAISPNLAVITNAFYRSQKGLPDLTEFNLKVLLMNKIWVGGGHRLDFATNMQLGVVTKRMRIGYVYEFPMGGYSYNLPGQIHEFTAVFSLFRDNEPDDSRPVIMW